MMDEQNDERDVSIQDLPDEILVEIFKYLNYYDLCRVGGACKMFHAITRYPVFWRRVSIQFFQHRGPVSETVLKFVGLLPTFVTHLKLNFEYARDCVLNLTYFLTKLQSRCPSLQVLIFYRANLMAKDNSHSVISLCEQLLANIRVLVFHNCEFKNDLKIYNNDTVSSKLEVLDASASRAYLIFDYLYLNYRSLFYQIPYLKKLYLADMFANDNNFLTDPSQFSYLELLDLERNLIGSKVFRAVWTYGSHLTELYVCFTLVKDEDIIFNDEVHAFPCLKIICLRACHVTIRGIESLIKTCPSLKHVYVGNRQMHNFHSFVDYSKCKSEKVQVVNKNDYCNHYAKIDYMSV